MNMESANIGSHEFEFPQNAETQAEKQECNVVAAFLSRVIV
ncbi:hypothetical protein J8TS2_10520 [Lederbergia ruris]|uniref:Uncharacterized protein n=1 Tax=Lederbergia ruris TaxID=217495 RepID=A0ABQ4KFI2_9BACI|nr:hypothetical protein [Lederbergia ruris]GIN56733.1 hypothetical protein J8TS2_10520 [Lederbergia ruris]